MKMILAAVLLAATIPAHAATAWLLDCSMQTSITGQMVYVGTYTVPGWGTTTKAFRNYCPPTIEVL